MRYLSLVNNSATQFIAFLGVCLLKTQTTVAAGIMLHKTRKLSPAYNANSAPLGSY